MVNPHFKLLSKTAKLPTQTHSNDSGVDFYSASDFVIPSHGFQVTNLGVSWNPKIEISHPHHSVQLGSYGSFRDSFIFEEMIKRFFKISMILKSRSGLSTNKNIEITTGGVIDEGYIDSDGKEAPIILKIYNHNDHSVEFKAGDKICQGLILLQPNLVGVPVLNGGRRGAKGFGSSGNQ